MQTQVEAGVLASTSDLRAITAFESTASKRHHFINKLFSPVDIASLVFFRVCFGALMFIEVVRYFKHGWIQDYFIRPAFHFTYHGFEWVHPWPGAGMYLHFCALGILGICIMLGYKYRASMLLFAVAFTYIFLLEQARYLNHFYLIILVSFLMVLVPAHKVFSVDATKKRQASPPTIPAWMLWLLRAQLSIVYCFAGVAKINGDWLRGEPMRMWLAESTDFPLIGRLFVQDWVVYLASYGGLLFDLLIAPMLLWRRTRVFAFIAAVLFHLMNAKLFSIGIFPWFMIAATTLFFSPGWPRIFNRMPEQPDQSGAERVYTVAFRRVLIGCNRVWVGCGRLFSEIAEELFSDGTRRPSDGLHASRGLETQAPEIRVTKPQLFAVCVGAVFLLGQVLLPLRHFIYPGNVSWTDEGHKFAWHMKLDDKRAEVSFIATDPETGESQEIAAKEYLTRLQLSAMEACPDMILEFSRYLADTIKRKEGKRVEIHVRAEASLNGRAPQALIDQNVDLAAQSRTFGPSKWILPLVTPLRQ